jgi:hypothetical protein
MDEEIGGWPLLSLLVQYIDLVSTLLTYFSLLSRWRNMTVRVFVLDKTLHPSLMFAGKFGT